MGEYVKKKKAMVFQSGDSLQQVVNVVNEAAAALNDKARTIRESPIPEVLVGALGAGIGGTGSFLALYGLGTVGLSAAGITSALGGRRRDSRRRDGRWRVRLGGAGRGAGRDGGRHHLPT